MVFVPTVTERGANSKRAYDLYSCLLKERIIMLTGEIDDAMSNSTCAQLLCLSSTSSEPIQMYINPPGSSVSAGLAIYDIMKYIHCDVSMACMEIYANMAAMLLSAGIQGKQNTLSNSEIMIHQFMGGVQGQAKDTKVAVLHVQKLKGRLYNVLSEDTQQSDEIPRWDCDRDYYMDAKEVLSYGLIDAIIQRRKFCPFLMCHGKIII